MWVRFTKIKTDPANAATLLALIGSDEVVGAASATGKAQTFYGLQATQDPGTVVAMTVWEDEESGQAFFQGPAYAKLAQQMRPYLLAPPEPAAYEIKSMAQAYAGAVLRYP
jgi:quinol monooxygenase YgiN